MQSLVSMCVNFVVLCAGVDLHISSCLFTTVRIVSTSDLRLRKHTS